MLEVLFVALGGAIGSAARYLVGGWFAARFGAAFPYGTFVVNVTGSFIVGLFLAYAQGARFIESLLAALLCGWLRRRLYDLFDL